MKPGQSWIGLKRRRESSPNEKTGWGLPPLASSWVSGSVHLGDLRALIRTLSRRAGLS